MRLNLSGLNELQERLERLRPKEVMAQALAEQVARMAARVRDGLSEQPGDAGHDEPWLRSGALRDSVGVQADGLQAAVGSSNPAAAPQELGTAHMPARPFLAPVAAGMGEEVARAVGAAVTAALRGDSTDANGTVADLSGGGLGSNDPPIWSGAGAGAPTFTNNANATGVGSPLPAGNGAPPNCPAPNLFAGPGTPTEPGSTPTLPSIATFDTAAPSHKQLTDFLRYLADPAHEGQRLDVYLDSRGIRMVGVGHPESPIPTSSTRWARLISSSTPTGTSHRTASRERGRTSCAATTTRLRPKPASPGGPPRPWFTCSSSRTRSVLYPRGSRRLRRSGSKPLPAWAVALALGALLVATGSALANDSGQVDNPYAAAGISDPRHVTQFFARLKQALAAGDRAAVATMINYPLHVYAPGRGSTIYRDAATLRAGYAQVFTPEVTAAIAAATPGSLFVRDQGVMIGNGQVWLNEVHGAVKISTINHTKRATRMQRMGKPC